MNKAFPFFSVLMTVYYKENPKNLDIALKSIEDQTLQPNEIVLVEDGHLGRNLESVVIKHKQKSKCHFKVIRLKKNMGRGYASQIGLSMVSNDWVARMDSDDVSLSNRFELQINAIQKDKDLKVVGGQIQEFEDDTQNVKGKRLVPLSFDEIKEYSKYRSPLNNPTVMFSKEAIETVGGFTAINVMEDYDLWVRLIARGYKMINLYNILVNMRVSRGMYSRRGGAKYLIQYMRMKNRWRKMGVGNVKTMLLSDLYMTINVFLPVGVRKIIYQKILHKR